MVADEVRTARTFFSWQSDVAAKETRSAIRTAIAYAAAEAESVGDWLVESDEATRSVAGAINIPFTIIEKINKADIFIADITQVASIADSNKKIPNPNVTFELGYAVAHLGWSRIVLLYSESVSPMQDLPFDFDRQRISPYKYPIGQKNKGDISALNNLVSAAIKAILVEDPKRPHELRRRTVAEIHQERDTIKIRSLLSEVSLSLIEDHIQECPQFIHYYALHYSDKLSSLISSPTSKLYDGELQTLLQTLTNALHETVAHDGIYNQRDGDLVQRLSSNHSPAFASIRNAAMKKIMPARDLMAQTLPAILEVLAVRYLELDLAELDKAARRHYTVNVESKIR